MNVGFSMNNKSVPYTPFAGVQPSGGDYEDYPDESSNFGSELVNERNELKTQVEKMEMILQKTSASIENLKATRAQRGNLTRADPELAEQLDFKKKIIEKLATLKQAFSIVDKKVKDKKLSIKDNRHDEERTQLLALNDTDVHPELDNVISENYIHIDQGNHWCEECDDFFPTIPEFLEHLQTDLHYKNWDKKRFEKPWKEPAIEPRRMDEEIQEVNTKGE